jgi:hypothetical protein
MKHLLRGVLLSFLVGWVCGVLMTERKHKQDAQAREDAFFNHPDVIDTIRESERLRRTDQWLNDIEDNYE